MVCVRMPQLHEVLTVAGVFVDDSSENKSIGVFVQKSLRVKFMGDALGNGAWNISKKNHLLIVSRKVFIDL